MNDWYNSLSKGGKTAFVLAATLGGFSILGSLVYSFDTNSPPASDTRSIKFSGQTIDEANKWIVGIWHKSYVLDGYKVGIIYNINANGTCKSDYRLTVGGSGTKTGTWSISKNRNTNTGDTYFQIRSSGCAMRFDFSEGDPWLWDSKSGRLIRSGTIIGLWSRVE